MDSDLYKYSIEKMAAIPAASDALARYTGNTCAIIFERQGFQKGLITVTLKTTQN